MCVPDVVPLVHCRGQAPELYRRSSSSIAPCGSLFCYCRRDMCQLLPTAWSFVGTHTRAPHGSPSVAKLCTCAVSVHVSACYGFPNVQQGGV